MGFAKYHLIGSFILLCVLVVECTMQLVFSGSNVHSIPFHSLHEGFVKPAYLAYQGFSSGMMLTCHLPAGSDDRGPSVFKGPWSNPTQLVDRGTVVYMDPNLSHIMDSSGYHITFTEVTPDTSGTYYCFASVPVSDTETRVEVAFAELEVPTTPTLFCMIHRRTDSVIFTGESPATPIHCLTNLLDLQNRITIRVDLLDPETDDQTEVALAASFTSDLTTFYRFGEIIFDIDPINVDKFNNSIVICSRMNIQNLCENIAPLKVYSQLQVKVSSKLLSVDMTSVEFTCVTSPNVIGTFVWSLSELSEIQNDNMPTMSIRQTSEGSILQLNNINLSGEEDYNLTVSCDVDLGKGISASGFSIPFQSLSPNMDDAGLRTSHGLIIFILPFILQLIL